MVKAQFWLLHLF